MQRVVTVEHLNDGTVVISLLGTSRAFRIQQPGLAISWIRLQWTQDIVIRVILLEIDVSIS